MRVIRRNDNRTWHGEALDGSAFVEAQKDHGADVEGAKALLVGAGGAGGAIALALLDAGIGELIIHDAAPSRVGHLARRAGRLRHSSSETRTAGPDGLQFGVQRDANGMDEGDPLPVNAALLNSSMFVGDVIAGHGETAFMRAARDAGCATADGNDMVDAVQNLMAEFLLGGARI